MRDRRKRYSLDNILINKISPEEEWEWRKGLRRKRPSSLNTEGRGGEKCFTLASFCH